MVSSDSRGPLSSWYVGSLRGKKGFDGFLMGNGGYVLVFHKGTSIGFSDLIFFVPSRDFLDSPFSFHFIVFAQGNGSTLL